ncbi:Planctomycete cytochrome C [Rosistilla carotiformis]|uniref:Planctomycete cytochrome C n=1 Tax=Rosistilla carotiformis TaxID=2528017 RepID=A0A518JLH7_9BACT|nr:PSD1 and planctomycete cytochrome C domain-containing protein [Rosistilla carotiformis]QDV66399.1 Planctomycete cytochrome C [Rosistilla carotiformis]
MVHRTVVVSLIILILCASSVGADEAPDFAREVLPILSKQCFACHGPDEETREGGLRLDTREHAVEELDSGSRAIVPGDADQSELMARVVTKDEFLQMPPPETGKSLSDDEKEILRRWVESGAKYSLHWAFQPIHKPAAPLSTKGGWGRNEVDAFVLAKLQAAGLSPSPEASPEELMRRLYLDLIGLPPTYTEVQEFASDPNDEAYGQIVDRLLASKHFGERWGRHWLDLARYADSNGYLGDELRPEAWRYRDWVIEAINNDLPYDQFSTEQIAGDLLEDATESQRIATGFHRNAMENTEAGVDKEADRVAQTVDRLSTFGTIWMGMTVGCAECHTHKFDPLTHQEFYQLYAFFNNLESDKVVLGYRDQVAEDSQEAKQREEKIDEIVAKILQDLVSLDPAQKELVDQRLDTLAKPEKHRTEEEKESLEHWLADLPDDTRSRLAEYEDLASKRPAPKQIVAPAVQQRRKPRQTFIHYRGDFRQPSDKVYPGTPSFLPPLESSEKDADRVDLAKWLFHPEHPLTARTATNHIWQHLFLEGMFRTEDNLGVAGDPPTHPQLLDWLAGELQENGWSRKSLIKTIVLSSTYRQSSQQTQRLKEVDPENRLLGRQFRYRLEAEIIRDLALSVSGLISKNIGGPSIRPPMNKRLTSISRNQSWDVSRGEQKYRRGMYILFRRATPFPMLSTFDGPDSTSACAAREISNSPLQSLTLLNDPVFFECAQSLGQQKLAAEEDAWISEMFQRMLSRNPTSEELAASQEFYRELLDSLENSKQSDLKAIVNDEKSSASLIQQAAQVLLARSLMNLDEFITRP